jgi:hypothetical protein
MPVPKASGNASSQSKQSLKPQKNLFSFFCKVDEKKNETKVALSPDEPVVLTKDSFSSQSPVKKTRMEVTPSSTSSSKLENVSSHSISFFVVYCFVVICSD